MGKIGTFLKKLASLSWENDVLLHSQRLITRLWGGQVVGRGRKEASQLKNFARFN